MENSNARDMANHEYPRDKSRPMHILHLPADILLGIFDHLHNCENFQRHIRDDDEIKTIQSARLVCSLFNRLASPFLLPSLTVQLDQTSLERADMISRTPLIAAGVRTIYAVLHYCPKELADDLSRYKLQREEDLNSLSGSCAWQSAGSRRGGEEYIILQKAIDDYYAITSAWTEYIRQPDVASTDEDTLRYQEILRQGYEAFRQKHEEQVRLIMDGSFVATLASAISRMRRCTSLYFVDEVHFLDYLNRLADDPSRMSTHPNELPLLMTAPLDWQTVEGLERGAELLPAKILSELPIAIHKAGATIPNIIVRCFPTANNYPMLRPGHDPNNPAWLDLRAASQHLTELYFTPGQPSLRDHHLRPEELSTMDQYFGAIISGQDIEKTNLHFPRLNIDDGGLYCIDTIFATVNWPRLKELIISYVSLNQGTLENFFRKLDGARVERIYLYDVELLDGSWAGMLDLLRERVASRCLDGKCEVKFSMLIGGEFEKRILTKTRSWEIVKEPHEVSKLIAQAQSFVSGVGLQNPLRVG
ncbi:hypothetical protein V496_05010 [Pseudogymnoascus sp. VKM F-4515 (FW-2607)]|nr:hypothetical protein V496_05010 [Pseudogymnoascus sp. VKM F-4515 (FW-2607)]KFY91620.1 hypothetical protein V498_05384 [Pseudogymnoascus sp. VKM F-4517 (FW-2822)]